MKLFIFSTLALALLLMGCSASKTLLYNFDSTSVTDSISMNLKKYEGNHGGNYLTVKWFALVRQDAANYELIITENTGGENFPFKEIIRKTNRFIKVSEQLRIPVIFDIDFLSEDFRKITKGTVNFGGYYFKISKEDGAYKVIQTGVLF